MPFKLIIFDCDGVLVDSESLGYRVLEQKLLSHGHQLSADEMERRFRGMKLADSLVLLEQETGIALPESFESDVRQRMSEVFSTQLQPIAGALELIRSLRVPCCVASNGPRWKMEENLKTTKLLPYLTGNLFSAYEHNAWKPDPGLYLAAAKHFGVAPEECIVIEDSVVGVAAGRAANMTVLGLSRKKENLEQGGQSLNQAHSTFESMQDIRRFLVTLNLVHT